MKYLLDTMALLAYFNNEEGANFVEEILNEDNEIFISSITLTEIHYIYSRRMDEKTADERVKQLKYNLDLVKIGGDEAIKAGRYKIDSIPIADALIAACADSIDAAVVTADPHYKKTDVDVINFR
ncbi:MAG: PIN domain-containing protein [Thermoplasmata archaeon]